MKVILYTLSLFACINGFGLEPETAEIYFDEHFALGPNLEEKYPSYIAGIEEGDGYFNTAENSWSVSSSADFGVGWLAIQIDRTLLSDDLALIVLVNPYEDTDLAIQLFNQKGEVVAVDLFANIVESVQIAGTDVCIIPLSKYPDASSILVRRIEGRVEITGCILFPVISEVKNTAESELDFISQLGDKPSTNYYNFLSGKSKGEDTPVATGPSISSPAKYDSLQLESLSESLDFSVFRYDKRRDTDVYFVPLFGFPMDLATDLAEDLEKELGIKITVSVHMGLSPKMYNAARNQYDAQFIAEESRTVLRRISYQRKIPFGVILTEKDINMPPFNLRYYYAVWFNDVSVVSTARMDPRSYGANWNRELLYNRFKKMIKKHIGYGFYRYKSSSNPNSVMYAPVMGMADLDNMGSEY
jgi:predicted Zn-dependent protease